MPFEPCPLCFSAHGLSPLSLVLWALGSLVHGLGAFGLRVLELVFLGLRGVVWLVLLRVS